MNAAVPLARDPIYPLPYAAALVGLDPNTARRWVRGYDYSHKGERRHSPPVLGPGQQQRPQLEITFEELLTLRLVRAFRDKGLGLPTIKKAAQIAAQRYELQNPFITRAFRSDGRAIFLDLKEQGKVPADEGVLINALTGQQQFRDVVEPSLFRDVVFAGDIPGRWYPQGKDRSVVIRPDRAFGAPHLDGTRIRTDVVADAVAAEGGDDAAVVAVAEWFRLKPDQVRDAVAAEEEWRTSKPARH